MKKLIALICALGLVVGLMAGCSGGDSSTGSTGGSQPQSQTGGGSSTSQEEAGDPYEIVIELVNYGMDIPDLALIEDAVNEIILPRINATIKFATVPISEQFMKLNLWVAGNEKIDLAMTGLTTNPANLVGQGVLLPITDLIAGSDILTELGGNYLAACFVGDELYSYPGILYPGKGVMFMYDKDLADEYGIKVPERVNTLEELEPVLQQVLDSGMTDKGIYPISFGDGAQASSQNLPATFDSIADGSYIATGAIMLDDASETIVNLFATEEYKAMLLRQRDWMEKGYVEPTSYSNGISVNDVLGAGMCFGVLNGATVGSSLAYWSSTTNLTLGGCWIGGLSISNADVFNMSWGIPVTCENPEKVIEFMEILYTDGEVATLLNYGIEGKHYERVEGTEHVIRYPEGLNGFTCGYGTFINWYGDTMTTYQREPLDDAFVSTIKDYTVEAGVKTVPSFGYGFDASDVSTELSTVTNVIVEYRPVLECGLVEDVEGHLAQFIKALEDAGIGKIIEENQAQFDAWKQSK